MGTKKEAVNVEEKTGSPKEKKLKIYVVSENGEIRLVKAGSASKARKHCQKKVVLEVRRASDEELMAFGAEEKSVEVA